MTLSLPRQNKRSKAFTSAALSGDGGPLTLRSPTRKCARISARNFTMLVLNVKSQRRVDELHTDGDARASAEGAIEYDTLGTGADPKKNHGYDEL